MSLKKLGLSDYESKIYEALLFSGRADAKKISKESKVPPTAVYPNLRSLEKKGFVETFSGETYLFEAVSPKKALDGFEEKKMHEFKEEKEQILKSLEKTVSSSGDFDPIKLSYGREASFNIFEELSSKAKKRAYIAGWKFNRASDVPTLVKQVKGMTSRGVDVKIIFAESTEITDYLRKEITKAGGKVKFFNIGNFSILVFDEEICKISLKSADRRERMNILMEDRDLSSSMAEYFNIIWKKAKN